MERFRMKFSPYGGDAWMGKDDNGEYVYFDKAMEKIHLLESEILDLKAKNEAMKMGEDEQGKIKTF